MAAKSKRKALVRGEVVARLPLAVQQAGFLTPRDEDRPRVDIATRRIVFMDDRRDAAMSMLLNAFGSNV